MAIPDGNLSTYMREDVVAFYASERPLDPAEELLFDRFIPKGSRILDIGVGGGRTTPALAAKASEYLGIDYSAGMVEACKRRFPELSFRVMDAADLSQLQSDSFDAVVFSFNGIDYLPADELRAACLREVSRVLRTGAVFIFSSHNSKVLLDFPILGGAGLARSLWRICRSTLKSCVMLLLTLPNRAFWKGHGYVFDPVHGGLRTHVTCPDIVAGELRAAGFDPLETVSGRHPTELPGWMVPWYYYAYRKASPIR